jgi:hypothetical protein
MQTIWADPDVCRLAAANLGCWQCNVGRGGRMLSVNPSRNWRCLQVEGRMFQGEHI